VVLRPDLPLVEAVHETFARAVELGHGDEDFAAVIEALGRRARA